MNVSLQDIALIGSLKVVRPSTQCLKEKNKEAWFNFVTAQNHSGVSLFACIMDYKLTFC